VIKRCAQRLLGDSFIHPASFTAGSLPVASSALGHHGPISFASIGMGATMIQAAIPRDERLRRARVAACDGEDVCAHQRKPPMNRLRFVYGEQSVSDSTEIEDSSAGRLRLVMDALSEQRDLTDSKREKARRMSSRFLVTQMTALAVTPILLAVSTMTPLRAVSTTSSFDWFRLAALIASGISLLTGSLLASFSYRERWQNYVRVSGNLQSLQLEGQILSSRSSLTDTDVEAFRQRLQDTLASGNTKWQKAISQAKTPNAKS
jgi:hypothetical protein